jgi:hypothetical protein
MRRVILPISKEPLWESTGLFLGTLAFPRDEQKARRYALAWCRDGALKTAASDPDYAQSAEPVRWFMVRDKEAEDLFDEADKALLARKAAYVATQTEFIGALSGRRITRIGGFGDRVENTRENAYVKANVWLGKPAGSSTKPLIRDRISPSAKAIRPRRSWAAPIALALRSVVRSSCRRTSTSCRRVLWTCGRIRRSIR